MRIAAIGICVILALDIGAAIAITNADHRGADQAIGHSVLFVNAVTAFSASSSVRIRGTTSVGGSSVALDVVAAKGRGGGTVSIGPISFQAVLSGKDLYLNGTPPAWRQLGYGPDADRLGGRWVRVAAEGRQFSVFARVLTVGFFSSLMASAPNLREGVPKSINGVTAIPFAPANRDGVTFYVQGTMVAERDASGLVTFGEYDTAQPPPVPTGAIDLGAASASQTQ